MAARYRWGWDIEAIGEMPALLFDEWVTFAQIQREADEEAIEDAKASR